ncbi:MAG: hypothetical protein RBT15_04570 [Gudongella sp.]|nr:hypothetical protein [Gudongella sp.]
MIDQTLMEVIKTPPDAALTIVTMGPEFPHVINSWNSYIRITDDDKILLPAGRMNVTEDNLMINDRILLTISNREVMGKNYKGTGFLIKGTAVFSKAGKEYEIIRESFPWARAVLIITIESSEQTL